MKLAGSALGWRSVLGGRVPSGKENAVMPSTDTRRTAPPDGWPETPPTYRATHGGYLAWAHVAVLALVAIAAGWAAFEVHELRADIERERGADMMGGKK